MATNSTMEFTPVPGAIVEKEGPVNAGLAPPSLSVIPRRSAAEGYPDAQSASGVSANDSENPRPELRDGISLAAKSARDDEIESPTAAIVAAIGAGLFGPNNERLDDLKPRVVAALRDLMLQFRSEGLVARRHEVRRIKQARLFWQGLQYAWWNPNDMSWHLPFESQMTDDKTLGEMPRYQFVTNLYQAFGLSFIALVSQDTPTTRFYPQSAQSDIDVLTARAANDVAALVEENNKVQQLLTGVGYYLWTDGKIGGYVRYVSDAQRFGWHNEDIVEEALVRLGEDAYVCPQCGHETPAAVPPSRHTSAVIPRRSAAEGYPAAQSDAGVSPLQIETPGPINSIGPGYPSAAPRPQDDEIGMGGAIVNGGANVSDVADAGPGASESANSAAQSTAAANFLAGAICPQCGAPLTPRDFRRAPVVAIPRVVGVRRVPNGQEVISILGGLELNTPVWANEMYEFPYLQWQQEVHIAKLRAAYPHAADKLILGGPVEAEDVYARASRVAVNKDCRPHSPATRSTT